MAKELISFAVRLAADGSDRDIAEALAPYQGRSGGVNTRAKNLIRRGLGLPEPAPIVQADPVMLRMLIREELQMALAGLSVQKGTPPPPPRRNLDESTADEV